MHSGAIHCFSSSTFLKVVDLFMCLSFGQKAGKLRPHNRHAPYVRICSLAVESHSVDVVRLLEIVQPLPIEVAVLGLEVVLLI